MTAVADLKGLSDPVLDVRRVGQPASSGVHRDSAPTNATLPYVVIGAAVLPETLALSGDGQMAATQRPVQIDVYQARGAEDDTLVPDLIVALDGAVLASGRYVRYEFQTRAPLLPTEGNIVRDAITVRLVGKG